MSNPKQKPSKFQKKSVIRSAKRKMQTYGTRKTIQHFRGGTRK